MRRILLAILMVVASTVGLTVSTVQSASATDYTCNGYQVVKLNPWAEQNIAVIVGYYDGMIPIVRHIDLIGNTYYDWCPDTNGPSKAKFRATNWCWTLRDDWGWRFQGATFNGYYFDDVDRDANPPLIEIPDDGTRHQCKYQNYNDSPWMLMSNHPGWKVSSWIHIAAYPDHQIDWTAGGDHIRNLDPVNDDTVWQVQRHQVR